MKYLKTFFITTILLSTGTIFNASYDNKYFAYTMEQPTEISETISSVPTVPIEEIPITEAITQKTASEEWNAHLATLGEHWDKTNNIPDDSWKTESFKLAKNVLEQDKNLAETLKSDFLAAINQQTTQITQAILNLIKEFDDIIMAKLSSSENKEKTEVTPVSTQETKKEEETTPLESLSTPVETTPAPETPTESSSSQTSPTSTTTSTTQEEDQLQQWNGLIADMKQAKGDELAIDTLLNKTNTLATQLLSAGKKTKQELQKEFNDALEILSLKKKLPKTEVAYRTDIFNRALSPEEYQQAQQYEQNLYQQQLATEQDQKVQNELQKFREEMAAKEAAKTKEKQAEEEARKKKELVAQASLLKLEQEGKRQTAETAAQIQALNAKVAAAQAKAQKEFVAQIAQPKATKKIATGEQATAEQGIFSRAVKAVTDVASNVKNWWYGSSETPVQAPTTLAELKREEDKEIEELEKYLTALNKDLNQQDTIINLWKNLQQILRKTPQRLDQYSIESNRPWITDLEHILTELIITHNIITIDQACDKIKNAFPESDYASQIVQKIKMDLEHIIWQANKQKQQEAEHRAQLVQKRQERKEQIILAQQKIKNEEDRIEAEKKKQLIAADDYKNHKKEWNQLLAQISDNTQATAEENHAHTTQAIKKSHSLLQLAHTIPSKDKQAVSQKLKQKFTVALLDQQRLNDTKLNIHHNMDHFNNEINKLID